MTRCLWIFTVAILLLGSGQFAWGHPGHGEAVEASSFWHYLMEPAHQWPILTAIVVVGAASMLFSLARPQLFGRVAVRRKASRR